MTDVTGARACTSGAEGAIYVEEFAPRDRREWLGGEMNVWRWRLAAVAVAAGMLGGAATAPALAWTRASMRNVRVSTTMHDPGVAGMSNFGVVGCPPAACGFSFDGHVSFGDDGGNMIGTSRYHATASPDITSPGVMVWEVWETFTGTVKGCGAGSISWHGTGTVDFSQFDPATQSAPMTGMLVLARKSGVGALVGATGQLSVDQVRMKLVVPAQQDGTITGAITCRVRTPRSGRR